MLAVQYVDQALYESVSLQQAPAFHRLVVEWRPSHVDTKAEPLDIVVQQFLANHPEVGAHLRAQHYDDFDAWGAAGFPEPSAEDTERMVQQEIADAWDEAHNGPKSYIEVVLDPDHPFPDTVQLTETDLAPYLTELSLLAVFIPLENEEMTPQQHKELLEAVKSINPNSEMVADISAIKDVLGKNSPNKDERTGFYKTFTRIDDKLDVISNHFKKAYWWGTGFAAALGFIGFKVM